MAASSEEKTEQPTPKRLKDLRKKNQTLRSPELVNAFALVALVAFAPMLFAAVAGSARDALLITLPEAGRADLPTALGLLGECAGMLMSGLAIPLAAIIGASLLTGLAIAKGRPNPWALKPRFEPLNPKIGFKRVFGTQGLVEAAKGLLKIVAVGAAAWFLIRPLMDRLLTDSLEGWLALLGSVAMSLLWASAAVGVAAGLFDLAYNLRRFRKQARMSKTEVKQEAKSEDGDPLLKAARRARQAALARTRMIEDVTTATVVLVNPTHIAVALRYNHGDPAPVVVARGAGVIADRIKAKAAEHDVPIRRDVPLARALFKACRPGQEIPVELYNAVALVLAAIFAAARKV